MKQDTLPSNVYICIKPHTVLDGIELNQSLVLTINQVPDSAFQHIEGEMRWHDRDQDPIYIDKISFLSISPPREGNNPSLEQIFSSEEFERTICDFAVVLESRYAYRQLIEVAGKKLSRRFLLKVHDLAALQSFSKGSRILRIFRERGWLQQILKRRERFFSFLAIERIFNEDLQDDAFLPEISAINCRLEIERSVALDFTADYTSILGEIQPINVVIGANGVGKTRMLLALASASKYGGLKVASKNHSVRPVRPSNILSFTYESSLWKKHIQAGVTVVNLGVGQREWRKLTAVLQELTLRKDSSFQIQAFSETIEPIIDPRAILIPIASPVVDNDILTIKGKRYIPLSLLSVSPQEEVISIDPSCEIIAWSAQLGKFQLSSGQRSLLLMMAQLFLHGERAIVLIDEPENHLHPQYITLLMRTLQTALIAMESRAIIVTHSPFVVRELDKNSVQILDRDAEFIPCLYQTSLQTFGGDVGQISEYVFGDQYVKKGYQELIENALNSGPPDKRSERAAEVSRSLGDDGELYLQKLLNSQSDAN